jgi:translation initiation factor IF-2
MSEKKATLIKRVGTAQKSESKEEEKKETTTSIPTPQKIEKKKVVVVKKRVVKVKPQTSTTTMQSPATKPSIVKNDGNKTTAATAGKVGDPKATTTTSVKKKSLHVSTKLKGHTFAKGQSPLHTGPVIIRSSELPPVPNQGQTAKAHAEWQSKNPKGAAESKVPSVGPRVAGTVGGKPVGGRPANRGGYNRNNRTGDTRTGGGYQGNNNRNSAGYTGGGYQGNNNQNSTGGYNGGGGYQGNNNRNSTGGYNGGGGYQGNNNRNSTGGYNGGGGYQGNNNRNNTGGAPGGYNRPAGNTGGYNRPGGNTGGGYNRPGGNSSNYRGNNNRGPQGGGFNRPGGGARPAGGYAERNNNNNNSGPQTIGSGKSTKKTFNKRRPNQSYQRRDASQEKEFQLQKKREQAAAALASVPKVIDIMDSISVADLAKKMNLKANDIIAKLFGMGMMVTINQMIDHDTAAIIAEEYNCKVNLVSLYDETIIESEDDAEEDLVPRAPIVTIMGHVDHGKTKLLDAIRSTDVVGGEFGGITQHIGAYKVNYREKGEIVFLDTPGHEAFTMMRARGAQITDIVVLVVAANDGVMPQTREAVDHAKAAGVPIIVAVNKCDLPDANPDRVMQQLSDLGLMPEDWGGTTLYCQISALKKQGIEELLDTILLQSEILDLKANPDARAEGKIIESRIDQGRGTVASVLIEKGTIHQGDYYVAGIYPGRVRAMFNDKGVKISEAGPATPVEIIGLSDIPSAGDPFQVTEDEKQARQVGNKRQELKRMGANDNNKFTLDTLYAKVQEGEIQSFNVIIKGDVQGSVEALQGTLEKLSTPEIRLNVIRSSAGAIIESDITLASASDALVIGFNVRPTPRALALAEQEKVEIRKYNVIYDVVDDVTSAMEGMLSPIVKEVEIGKVEVRDTFKVPRIGLIAGCYVTSGKVKRNSLVKVIRDNIQLSKSLIKLTSLKRFKDDAKEVTMGYECGIGLENFQDLKSGDILEIIETEKVARKLVEGNK